VLNGYIRFDPDVPPLDIAGVKQEPLRDARAQRLLRFYDRTESLGATTSDPESGRKVQPRVESAKEVAPVPQCDKCGEIYMDTAGECPTCRKRKQRTFTAAVLVLFAVGAIVAVIFRFFVWQ